MESKLDELIEETASKYGFKTRIRSSHVNNNKAFLAMLDHYIGKINYKLPSPVKAMDLGCGKMPYADGLITFLEQYGAKQNETRHVQLVGIDKISDFSNLCNGLISAFAESKSTKLYLIHKVLENRNDMEEITKETGIDMFDIVTIFAPSIPQDYIKNYPNVSRYITTVIEEALKPKMTKGGLLVISTSPGEALKNQILESLDIAGFGVLVNKWNNKFINKLSNWPYTYNDMIIAKSIS